MSNGDSASETSRGYLYAILGALGGGSIPTLFKIVIADNAPVAVSGAAMLLSGFLLLLYRPRAAPSRGGLPYILLIGLVGAAAAPVLWAVGISETTVVNASLLANGEVLFTAVIAMTLLGERLSRVQTAMGGLIVAGILIVSTNLDLTKVQFFQGLVGNLLILGSMLAWGFENNVIVYVSDRISTPILSKFRNLIGGTLVTTFALLLGLPLRLSAYDAFVFVLLVTAYAGTTYLFIGALQKLGAIKMILVYSVSTVFSAALALVVLGEQITIAQLLGGALIIMGVYLFRRSDKPTVSS
jgi:drug/metabolite transporter (DMT)-like permease